LGEAHGQFDSAFEGVQHSLLLIGILYFTS
jgi:hypothetical protein